MVIPKSTTGFVQPLDVFGSRFWKSFVIHFNDLVILHDVDVNSHLRDNILRIQPFTHNQSSSPRFHNLWKYSWYKPGFHNERPPKTETPESFVFRNPHVSDQCSKGEDISMITRACCKICSCLQHSFHDIHICDVSNQ